jgi:hypothetical protein
MRLIILIALLAAGQAMADNLTLIGLVSNDNGYTLHMVDTDVAISNSVATAANLANWVDEQVEVQAQGTIVESGGERIITVTSITSVVITTAEE